MRKIIFSFFISTLLCACAILPDSNNPYPGSGGLYLGTPSREDITSGRSVFDEEKFSSFKIGVTTKKEIAEALGKPANWKTNPDGTSEFGYNYVEKKPVFFRQVKEARFVFDQNFTLKNMNLPKF